MAPKHNSEKPINQAANNKSNGGELVAAFPTLGDARMHAIQTNIAHIARTGDTGTKIRRARRKKERSIELVPPRQPTYAWVIVNP